MAKAIDLLRNKFGVSQLYQHDVVKDGETVLTVYWNPLTIAERESIQKKAGTNDANDFALALMIQKKQLQIRDKSFSINSLLL